MREPQLQQAKIKVKIVSLGIIFLVLLLLGGQIISRLQYQPVDANDKTKIELSIPEGSSANQVAGLLKAKD
ncbi:MAG TPA: hypothetical protein PKI17_05445, partial [Syntrophomonas sp.]|nr:hypothetical protein [Syntrophomonas sp.]